MLHTVESRRDGSFKVADVSPQKVASTSRSRDRIVCLQFRDVLPVFCRAVAGFYTVMKVGAFEKAVEVIYAPVVLLVKSNFLRATSNRFRAS